MKLPDVFGLVLCERLEVDPTKARVSLGGIFHSLRFTTFPTPPQRFTAYAALYDGVGEGTMRLVITEINTEKDRYVYSRWLAFPGRQQLVNLEVPVTSCVIPAPGRYRVRLYFDGHCLTERFLNIHKVTSLP